MIEEIFENEIDVQKIATTAALMTIIPTIEALKDGKCKDECLASCEKLKGLLEDNLDHLRQLGAFLEVHQMFKTLKSDPVDNPLPFMPKGSVAIDVNELLRQLGKEDKGNDRSNS